MPAHKSSPVTQPRSAIANMPLDDAGMQRLGHAFIYRIVPVLIVTILYGLYIATLILATYGLRERGLLRSRANSTILLILYILFCLTSALWSLEVAQLIGLNEILLYPNDLSTDSKFNSFYALIARETKITGVLFETQMIIGDILVIWRCCAIWHDRKILWSIPLFFWGLMIVNMSVHAAYCRSGVSTTNYNELCKATDISAPVLSIVVNLAVMGLTIWKIWVLRDTVVNAFKHKTKNRVLTMFTLLIESGTLYVLMLVTDLLITSYVIGTNETVQRMISCISGYSTVQFVAIYPTLMLVILRSSVWNASDETYVKSISALDCAVPLGSRRRTTELYYGETRKPATGTGFSHGQIESGIEVGMQFAPPSSIGSRATEDFLELDKRKRW